MSQRSEYIGMVSPDGLWQWDGYRWIPFAGPPPKRLARWPLIAIPAGCGLLLVVGLVGLGLGLLSVCNGVQSQLQADDAALNNIYPAPTGFPTDFPVYAHSSLSTTITGRGTYKLKYLSQDPARQIADYYRSSLDEGDWHVTRAATDGSASFVDFERRSDPTVHGTVAVGAAGSNRVVPIWITLVAPAGR